MDRLYSSHKLLCAVCQTQCYLKLQINIPIIEENKIAWLEQFENSQGNV
jgi:hypothetical protein